MGRQMSDVNCQYGAPMGRGNGSDHTAAGPVRCFRVRLDSGGYDDGGAYWGGGQPLYCATDGAEFEHYTRADDRADAKAQFAERYPSIRFLR